MFGCNKWKLQMNYQPWGSHSCDLLHCNDVQFSRSLWTSWMYVSSPSFPNCLDLQWNIQCYSPEGCILLQTNYSTIRSWWQKWQRWWLYWNHSILRVKMADTGAHWWGWNKMSNSCTLTKICNVWILPYYSPQGLLTSRPKKYKSPM